MRKYKWNKLNLLPLLALLFFLFPTCPICVVSTGSPCSNESLQKLTEHPKKACCCGQEDKDSQQKTSRDHCQQGTTCLKSTKQDLSSLRSYFPVQNTDILHINPVRGRYFPIDRKPIWFVRLEYLITRSTSPPIHLLHQSFLC